MSERSQFDALVIGAGHNGLVTGAYLARAGRRVLILERRERVGGILVSDGELAPGVSAPGIAHTVGRLRPGVIRDLGLEALGFRRIRPDVRVFAPQPDGSALTLWADPRRTAEDLRSLSGADARAYPDFDRRVRAIASFVVYLNTGAPPDVQSPSTSDAVAGLRLGRAFRRLGPRAGREALRVLPMAVADLVGEVFERDEVRGAIASRAVQFTAMGPWTAGTAAVLLADSAGNDGGAAGQTVFARGGGGALAHVLASAARGFGAEIRTGAEVAAVTTIDRRANGVALSTGEEIRASAVVSSADPKRTLLEFVDPELLGPTLVWRASNIRMPGCTAKVNLALSGPPRFLGAETEDRLHGRVVIAPGIDYLERGADAAKYGRVSPEPYLEVTIPSLTDPTLAPPGQHVMSVIAQWAPHRLREGSWEVERDGLGDLVVKTLETRVFGSMVRSRLNFASADVNGSPLWKRTPGRSLS